MLKYLSKYYLKIVILIFVVVCILKRKIDSMVSGYYKIVMYY